MTVSDLEDAQDNPMVLKRRALGTTTARAFYDILKDIDQADLLSLADIGEGFDQHAAFRYKRRLIIVFQIPLYSF